MCGISGIINKNNKGVDKNIIKTMNDLIAHRGPNGEGFYFENNFAFGHRRLSVLDLSNKGNQPMKFNDKYVITYNGEIYNYLDIKTELIKLGYKFKSNSDTEVILAAYDRWKFDCVEHFVGMWAFSIYDVEKKIIFSSRDRFGIKPFYYYETKDNFYFASEIKQFTVLNGWKACANRNRVMDFLMFEMFDHTDETLFENVLQLRAGNNLIYDLQKHTYKISEYYCLEDKVKDNQDELNIISHEFYEIFKSSIKLHLQSDVKVGSCLSGGLDSSSIVCMIDKIIKENGQECIQETVSSCFKNKKYDEQQYIDEVANFTGITSYKVFPEFDDLFKIVDEITWHQDEPFGSTSIFAQWNVFKTAKEKGITVMLDGQGADEQLAGYGGFYDIYLSELIKKCKWIKFYKEAISLKNLYGYSFYKIFRSTIKYIIPNWLKSIIKTKTNFGVFGWVNIDKDYYGKYLNSLYGTKINSLKQYSINQLLYSSLPKLLHYEDRDSMAHSIESRVPFLDHRLVEFVISIPSEYKIKKGITKYIMRNSMTNVIPEKIGNRVDKMGFVTPEQVWIRENSDLFRKEIEDACDCIGDIIKKEKVLEWYDKLIESNDRIDFTIWRLVSLGRWIRVFKVKI